MGIPRIGWVNAGVRDPETVAEHTLLVSYIAASLAKEMGLDAGKAALLSLIHDAAESTLGNVPRAVRDRVGLSNWRLLEMGVLSELGFGEEFSEYAGLSSREALVVAVSDKLATLIRACQYAKQGYDTADLAKNYLNEVRELLGRLGNSELSDVIEGYLADCGDLARKRS